MIKPSSGAKWTRGRSRVARVTKGTKTNLASKQNKSNLPLKFLNSIFQKGK